MASAWLSVPRFALYSSPPFAWLCKSLRSRATKAAGIWQGFPSTPSIFSYPYLLCKDLALLQIRTSVGGFIPWKVLKRLKTLPAKCQKVFEGRGSCHWALSYFMDVLSVAFFTISVSKNIFMIACIMHIIHPIFSFFFKISFLHLFHCGFFVLGHQCNARGLTWRLPTVIMRQCHFKKRWCDTVQAKW